ncbi:MAG: 50S ribosomal protein L29 [Nitrospiraceae bacterium]
MEAKDIRGLTDEELREKEGQLQQELFNYRFQMATGRLENLMLVRKTRRDLARVKGIRREAALAKKAP